MVKTKVLLQHSWNLGGLTRIPEGPPTLKGSKQVCSIYPSFEKFKKPEDKDDKQKSDLQTPTLIIKIRIDRGAWVSWPDPCLKTHSHAHVSG